MEIPLPLPAEVDPETAPFAKMYADTYNDDAEEYGNLLSEDDEAAVPDSEANNFAESLGLPKTRVRSPAQPITLELVLDHDSTDPCSSGLRSATPPAYCRLARAPLADRQQREPPDLRGRQ